MALGDAYITSARLKTFLNIGDSVDDTDIASAVAAGCSWVTQFCGRDFQKVASPAARVYVPYTSTAVLVDDFHTTTGLVVKDGDNFDGTWLTTRAATAYRVAPLSGYVAGRAFPYHEIELRQTEWAPGSVEITAAWGWAAVPDDVTLAALIMSARFFKRRNSPEGVLGGFSEYGPIRVGTRTDPDVEALLSPYVRRGVMIR